MENKKPKNTYTIEVNGMPVEQEKAEASLVYKKEKWFCRMCDKELKKGALQCPPEVYHTEDNTTPGVIKRYETIIAQPCAKFNIRKTK